MPSTGWRPRRTVSSCRVRHEARTTNSRERPRASAIRVITTAPKVASDSRPVDRPQARDQVNTLDRDRTCNLQLRRLTLYPIELRGRAGDRRGGRLRATRRRSQCNESLPATRTPEQEAAANPAAAAKPPPDHRLPPVRAANFGPQHAASAARRLRPTAAAANRRQPAPAERPGPPPPAAAAREGHDPRRSAGYRAPARRPRSPAEPPPRAAA